jgi:hypothetical protein
MNPTLTGPRRLQPRQIGPSLLTGVLAAAVLGVVLISPATQLPSFIPHLSLANPTGYAVEIDVRAADDSGWLNLGSVRRESRYTIDEVLDQGDQWIFRFRYGGEDGGELVVSRAELRADRWRITVPAEVGERLQREGFEPSAR